MASKRRREITVPDTQLIEIYEDLANEDEEIRLRAAHNLLSKFALPSSSSPEKLKAISQRLFRGLCSSRKAARLGFSIALTEFLAQVSQHPPEETGLSQDEILGVLEGQTTAQGSTTGQDERDHYFGRLFGAEAVVKSCTLFQPQPSLKLWRKLLQLLCDLALKKQWLRQECGWLFYTSVDYLRSLNLDSEFPLSLIKALNDNSLIRTPEGVALWLKVGASFPDAALPRKIWKHRDPLNKDEATVLGGIMKDAKAKSQPESHDPKAPQGAGTWSQHLHFSWDVVLGQLYSPFPTGVRTPKNRLSFARFWADVVDPSLFSPSSSAERKHWGLLLVAKVFATGPSSLLEHVFTANTVRLLVDHLKVDDRYLYRSASKAVETLQARALKEPNIIPTAIKGLSFGNYEIATFDSLTKTKTIAKLLTAGDLPAYKDLILAIRGVMEQPEATDEKHSAARRRMLADLLVSICSQILTTDTKPQATVAAAEDVLDVFIPLAYSTRYLEPGATQFEPPLSSELRVYLRSRIKSCLNHIIQSHTMHVDLLKSTVRKLRALQNTEGSNQALLEFDTETQRIIDTAWNNLGELVKTESLLESKADSLPALEMLYSLAIVQLHDEDADAPGILQDLNIYYQSNRQQASESGHSVQSDVLVECLLSFASKTSNFFHQTVLQTFQIFASQLTKRGIQSLTRILETKERSTGSQALFDTGYESDESLSDVDWTLPNGRASISPDSDSDVLDSDVEEVSARSSSSEEQMDEESDHDQAELEAFDAKLAAALGARKRQVDADADDAEDSDEDMYEENMDEDEMRALDEKLAEVFRARKSKIDQKKERKDTKEAIINLKRRVLDLIEVYLKQEQLNPLALDLVIPLVKTERKSNVKQISDRAHEVLHGFCSRCKGSNVPDGDISPTEVLEYLKRAHEEAGLGHSKAHASTCSKASILFVKVLVKANADVGMAVDVYAETRKRQLRDVKFKVQPIFFTDWNNWCTSARDRLLIGRRLDPWQESPDCHVNDKHGLSSVVRLR